MGLRMAMVGVGQQGRRFVPLFNAHPLVDELALCDLDEVKLQGVAAQHGISRTYPSLDAVCESDVDAVVIITQNWLHAPQAVQALRAGKHVFSAVPTGITVDEIETLVRTVEQTGLIYMLGEVNYYSPETVYCRRRHASRDFGDLVYAEADYHHDFDELYEVFQWRGGERWREVAGIPPMLYPTHTTGSIVSVTGARMTHVS
jgi:predicted dehydrogenase